MSIVGLGLDLVELARIRGALERHGPRFVDRICRAGEPQERAGDGFVEHLGGLFAAKEAVLKALGTGWAQGLGFRQVEVERGPGGSPGVRLHGAAADRARALGVGSIHLSITHERTHAAAVAILDTEPSALRPAPIPR